MPIMCVSNRHVGVCLRKKNIYVRSGSMLIPTYVMYVMCACLHDTSCA